MQQSAVSLPIVFSLLQTGLTFVALIWRNDVITEAIRQLQAIVDQREYFHLISLVNFARRISRIKVKNVARATYVFRVTWVIQALTTKVSKISIEMNGIIFRSFEKNNSSKKCKFSNFDP